MNWIKMRTNLAGLDEVEDISDTLEVEIPTVIGCLYLFWAYADQNTVDGSLKSKSRRIDRKTMPGFTKALLSAGWLEGRDGSYNIPHFDRHNSQSAKARALESEAKRLRRELKASEVSGDGAEKSDTLSDTCPTKSPTREEKRREEKKKPPSGDPLRWSPQQGWEGITDEDMDGWAEAYPACDAKRQLAAMNQWLRSNPSKAKKKCWRRFVTNWLAGSQERGGDIHAGFKGHAKGSHASGSNPPPGWEAAYEAIAGEPPEGPWEAQGAGMRDRVTNKLHEGAAA